VIIILFFPSFLKNRLKKHSIYPIDIPDIVVQYDLDLLLLELPPRYLPFMPNGIGYVHNILKKTGIKFQTIDANIIIYHRWHSKRVLENKDEIQTSSGFQMSMDPWDTSTVSSWSRPDVIEYFWPQIDELIDEIASKRPKMVAFSLHGSNAEISQRFVKSLRERYPDLIIIVGGYSCRLPKISPLVFPYFDYMVINEAELTLEPLISALVQGKKPKDITGIISKFDSADRVWVDTPLPDDLDAIDFPRYEWIDLALYRTYKGDALVPISASRGCIWSKCNFCGEHCKFRKRQVSKIVDEMEFFISKGFNTFHFNESDVNGDPHNLYDVCSEILKRNLKVKLMGQLRINKLSTSSYFNHLAKAGFVHLRFGVDGWTDHILRLQKKGYLMNLVFQNLHDCHAAGIYTTVNMVIGVPGETDDDVEGIIQNIISCKNNIDKVESLNVLLLIPGSEYYNYPEKFNIRFREDKDKLYRENLYLIPPEKWYSENPYIDHEVRLKRLERICIELYKEGFDIAPFVQASIKELLETKSPSQSRSGFSDLLKRGKRIGLKLKIGLLRKIETVLRI